MDRHILHRLLLAKVFLRDARAAAQTSVNDLSLSRSVVYLHDAVDNVVGALATRYDAKIGARDGLMDMIAALEKSGVSFGNRSDLTQLNGMRNAIKHHGVPQNAAAVTALFPAVVAFCDETVAEAFGVNLDAVTITLLIESQSLRERLDEIETQIADGEYKTALERLAIVRFDVVFRHDIEFMATFKKHLRGVPLKEQVLVFPSKDEKDERFECLELGIDPHELTRFEWLTPEVGFNNMEDRNLVMVRKETFWHHRNWTHHNAMLCFNFLVGYLAARQRSPNTTSIIRRRSKTNEVTFVQDSSLFSYAGEVLRLCEKGETLRADVSDFVDGEWQNHDEDRARLSLMDSDISSAYVVKSHVSVGPDEDESFQ